MPRRSARAAGLLSLPTLPCTCCPLTSSCSPFAPPPPTVPKQDRKAGSGKIGEASGRGMVDLNPPRGTRDFFPDDKRLQNWLFGEFAAVSRLYGFEQIDFPVLESGEKGGLGLSWGGGGQGWVCLRLQGCSFAAAT